ALAVGSGRSEMLDHLEAEYSEGMDLDGGIGLALETLSVAGDDAFDAAEIGVATVDVETEQFRELADDEIEPYLSESDLLESDEPDEERFLGFGTRCRTVEKRVRRFEGTASEYRSARLGVISQ